MIEVVGVIVEQTKNIYYVSPNSVELKLGDYVVFEQEKSMILGRVFRGVYLENPENLVLPLYNVLRVATSEDLEKEKANKNISNQALFEAKRFSEELSLEMNFIDAYYYLDNSQLIFFFLSDTRVDFRDLVRKLAQKYRTRIELRQIGVRDKAKKVGGLGPCGLFLCCNSFLTDFTSVSINMAKNQMLALNPSKINGICGRLLCCLGYENDVYTELKADYPKLGSVIETSQGSGKVTSIDIFKKSYTVDFKEKGVTSFMLEEKDGED